MCLHPLVITYRERLNSDDDIRVYHPCKHSVLVTCGKCDECVKRYQNDWMIRNLMQFRESAFAVFFTLTYNERSVPVNVDSDTGELYKTVCKRDLQLFLKRFREFRRKRGLSTDFKYFITSEYGPLTLRPHYHGLLHGIKLSDFMEFSSAWRKQYGFTMQRQVVVTDLQNAMNSARYTAKYCAKGDFENPLVDLCKVEPTFHLISKGLGKCYINERNKSYHLALDIHPKRDTDGKYFNSYLEQIFNRSRIMVGSFGYHMPRYYKEAFFEKRKNLQVAYSDYVCSRILDEYDGKLEQIQTDKPYRTRFEASIVLYNKTLADERQRASDGAQSLTKHFKKSKI